MAKKAAKSLVRYFNGNKSMLFRGVCIVNLVGGYIGAKKECEIDQQIEFQNALCASTHASPPMAPKNIARCTQVQMV